MNSGTQLVAIGVAIGLIVALSVGADFSTTNWRWQAPLAGDATGGQYAKVDLPPEIFPYLKPDLSDLRVIGQGRELPYLLMVEEERAEVEHVSTRLYNLSSDAASTSFILDLGTSGTINDSVTINTSSENFRRSVSVEGSADETNWRMLTRDGHIFDYTVRDERWPVAVRDTRVDYPEATFRYLRITIHNNAEAPLKVSGAAVYRRVNKSAHEIVYEPKIDARVDTESRATEVVADLGASGVPHRQGELTVAGDNFNRAVAIYDSDNGQDWRLLTNDYIFSFATPLRNDQKFAVRYPESNRRYLKLAILNYDDEPLAVTALRLRGVARRLLLPVGAKYLFLGNTAAVRPRYDIEKLAPYVDAAALVQLTVGTITPNAAYVAPVPPTPQLSERLPYLLPTLLAAIVLALTWLLYRVASSLVRRS